MTERHVFFADVHLRREQKSKRDALIGALKDLSRPDFRVYLLGDMFDIWIGPDQLEFEKELRPLFDAFGRLVEAGGKLTWFHGNRDFHMGRYLTRRIGAETIADDKIVDLDGRQVYLCHGDMLCTGDQLYHVARWIVRGPVIRTVYSVLPATMKFGMNAIFRDISRRQKPKRRIRRHGVNADRVASLMQRGVDVIICGHVHQARDEVIREGGRECRLIVLPPWEDKGSLLEYADGEFTTREIAFP